MSPVRVGANLAWIVPGVVGGSEDYTVGMLRALARSDLADHELTLFVNRRFAEVHTDLCETWPTVVLPVSGRSKVLRVGAESTVMGAEARRRGVEVFHHMGGLVPTGAPGRPVLTLHDLQPLLIPEHFGPLKQRYHRVALPSSVRRAERIVTLSRYTGDEVCARFGVDPANISVLPPGTAPEGSTADAGEADIARVRRDYGLAERPYFLYPAITYPHKNHVLVIAAMAALAKRHPEALVVLTGGRAAAEADLARAVREAGVVGNVRRPGRVPGEDLDALYAGAVAVVFPSLFEGFGLPVTEAMRRGTPVLASSATALPEVVGSGGILLDPYDPAQWSAAMNTMLEDPEARRRLAEAGHRRVAEFSWQRSAEGLVSLWREVAGR